MYGIIMLLLYLIIIGVPLFISYLVAKKFEKIAFQKGYNESIHSFAMCFWLGIVGYLYVIALPDLKNKADATVYAGAKIPEEANTVYQCPTCKNAISYGINQCPSCGQIFEWKR